MPLPRLHVLPWDRPLLSQAVAWLAGPWSGDAALDLSDQLVIVPTRQAGRRLREALAGHAAQRGQAVFPPRVIPPDGLLSQMARGANGASRLEATLAWIDVLREVTLAEFEEVFPVAPPARNFAWAARLARELLHLQQTLAENNLRIADIPSQGAKLPRSFPEAARWQQLARLEARYDAALARRGRCDPEGARIAATPTAGPPGGTRRIVVLATPDPPASLIALLETFAQSITVEVVIFGPANGTETARLFDGWGRPHAGAWAAREWSPPDFDARVHLCADPAAQAERMVTAATAAGATAGWIALGLADPEVSAPLRHGLNRAGLTAYDPEGQRRQAEPLHEVLRLLLAGAREPTFDTIAALARCPDILRWLRATLGPAGTAADLLAGLDELRTRHLPASLAAAREHAPALARSYPHLGSGLDALAGLQNLAAGRSFPENVRTALAVIFGPREFALENANDARAVDTAVVWLDTLRETAEAAILFPGLAARDAWELALDIFAESRRFEEKAAGAVELQGWLELLWEDAPHLVVAGLNDGHVPAAVVGDPFLPESLRAHLGLRNNATRLARDAYLLEALAMCRESGGRLDILLGRTSITGDPLRPSRLLLRCADSALPRRVSALFREAGSAHHADSWRRAWPLLLSPAPAITRLSVTAFRDHLACPFRFHLRHVRRMTPVDPRKAELDARDFGTLCHAALEALGRDPDMSAATDAPRLREFLLDRLDATARARYGTELSLPLLMQLESARQRLAQAAIVQAAQRAEGWVIERVEQKFEILLHGLTVVGKIDRIDRHETTGLVRVVDYKTSDKPVNPRHVHVRKPRRNEDLTTLPAYAQFTVGGEVLVWTDLQLPLYRRALAAEFGPDLQAGYFNLPRAASETAVALWTEYGTAWQAAADTCADGITAAVAAGRYWPPAEIDPAHDDFATLFHHGTAGSVVWDGGQPP